jgi:hypothetical protein
MRILTNNDIAVYYLKQKNEYTNQYQYVSIGENMYRKNKIKCKYLRIYLHSFFLVLFIFISGHVGLLIYFSYLAENSDYDLIDKRIEKIKESIKKSGYSSNIRVRYCIQGRHKGWWLKSENPSLLSDDIVCYIISFWYLSPDPVNLYLSKSNITDECMLNISNIENLSLLDIHGTNISDIGIMNLNHIETLEFLNICNTNITSKGLCYIPQQFPYLRELRIDESLRNSDGFSCLRSNLKRCIIYNDSGDVL